MIPHRAPAALVWIAAIAFTLLLGTAVLIGRDLHTQRPPDPPQPPSPLPELSAHSAGNGVAWRLVGLGDSITAGQNCAGCQTFLELFAHTITATSSNPVDVVNLGVSGSTSADLLGSFADPALTAELSGADIITVTIGANDFLPMLPTALDGQCGGADGLACFTEELDELGTNLTAIIDRIHQIRQDLPTAIRVTGYWNVFLDGQVADQVDGVSFHQTSNELTRRANAVIREVAHTKHVTYVDLYTQFKGTDGGNDDTSLLAPDGTHPDQAGHQAIAEALTQATSGGSHS